MTNNKKYKKYEVLDIPISRNEENAKLYQLEADAVEVINNAATEYCKRVVSIMDRRSLYDEDKNNVDYVGIPTELYMLLKNFETEQVHAAIDTWCQDHNYDLHEMEKHYANSKPIVTYKKSNGKSHVESVNGYPISSDKHAYQCKVCGAIVQSKSIPFNRVFPTQDPRSESCTHNAFKQVCKCD